MSLGGVGRPSRKGAVQHDPVVSKAGLVAGYVWEVRSTVGVMGPRVVKDRESSVGDMGRERREVEKQVDDTCGSKSGRVLFTVKQEIWWVQAASVE
jgi:hypothetical protein